LDAGQLHGKGVLTWADGESYDGEFIQGQRTGKGVYISQGGDRYEGSFTEGKRDGQGVLISADNVAGACRAELKFQQGVPQSFEPEHPEAQCEGLYPKP